MSQQQQERTNRRVERWISAVENATHTSRLLLLFQMLNDSVRWDMYHYQRTRVGVRKNYADINQGKESDEEEVSKKVRSERLRNRSKAKGDSSSADEEETAKKVRTKRLRNRNKAKEDSSSEEEEEQITRSQRLRKRNRQKQPSSSEDDEPRRGRSTRSRRASKRTKVESEEEGGSRYGLRKRAKVEAEESDEEEEVPRSSRRRSARRSRYESEESEQEEEAEDEEEEVEGSSMEEGSDDAIEEEEEDESDEDVPIHEDEEFDLCREVFKKMKDYKCACPFKYPVDPEEVVDYHEIITNPISLQDIGKKIEEEEYCGNQFVDDMKLLFDNADSYNQPDNFIMKQCAKLNNIFIRLYTEKFGRSKAHMEYFSTHFQA